MFLAPAQLQAGSDTIDAYRTAEKLAASPDQIVVGHDPLVIQYYPLAAPTLEDMIVRLEVAPKTA